MRAENRLYRKVIRRNDMELIGNILAGLIITVLIMAALWLRKSLAATKGARISRYEQPRQALLVVDIQEDFTGAASRLSPPIKDAEGFIATVNQVIETAVARGMLVVYIGHELPDNLFSRFIGRGMVIAGKPGAKQDSRLVMASEHYFSKSQADAYANIHLERWLVESQVNEVFIVGLDAVACAYKTAKGALNRNYRATIIIDAVATNTKKTREELIKLYRWSGIEVLESAEFIAGAGELQKGGKVLLRGVRGATTVDVNEQEQILDRVTELLTLLVADNDIQCEDIAAVIFSSTPDLNAAFPAKAARGIGWSEVPLFGTQEIENPDGMPMCIRVLLLWNTAKDQRAVKHAYLRGAALLRQDLVNPGEQAD